MVTCYSGRRRRRRRRFSRWLHCGNEADVLAGGVSWSTWQHSRRTGWPGMVSVSSVPAAQQEQGRSRRIIQWKAGRRRNLVLTLLATSHFGQQHRLVVNRCHDWRPATDGQPLDQPSHRLKFDIRYHEVVFTIKRALGTDTGRYTPTGQSKYDQNSIRLKVVVSQALPLNLKQLSQVYIGHWEDKNGFHLLLSS